MVAVKHLSHVESEKETRKVLLAFLGAGALVAGALCGSRWLQIDRCLDNGGRWNYEVRRCEGTTP